MTMLMRRDPWQMIRRHRAMDPRFRGYDRRPFALLDWQPFRPAGDGATGFALDVYEEEGNVIVKASLPGLSADDVKVDFEDGRLTISAETKAEDETTDRGYYLKELRYGAFSRSVVLPEGAQAGKATAGYEDGVLTVAIPKSEEAQAKRIEVKAGKTGEKAKKAA